MHKSCYQKSVHFVFVDPFLQNVPKGGSRKISPNKCNELIQGLLT